jgi:hypothetical protein
MTKYSFSLFFLSNSEFISAYPFSIVYIVPVMYTDKVYIFIDITTIQVAMVIGRE